MTTVGRRPTHPTSRRAHRWLRALAAAGVAGSAVLVAPGAAAATPASCVSEPFGARSTADLLKVTVLDVAGLGVDLPALLDVRLGDARGEVRSDAEPHKASATARYADAKLLGLQLPGLPAGDAVARQQAPRQSDGTADVLGPHQVSLPSLDTGLVTVDLGTSTAEAHWDDAYRCGATGPLTRASTKLADVAVLGRSGRVPGVEAVNRATGAGRRTSLLRLGPSAAAQSATDVVRVSADRVGVAAGAGVALSDLTLFDGTNQEISVKVVTQPKLIAVAGGSRDASAVTYQGPVLDVTAAGKNVASLDTTNASVTLDLFGRAAPAGRSRPPALLSVRLSLGGLRQEITDDRVAAEAASLRVEVLLGRTHLLDVALGYLSVEATAPVMTAAATPTPAASPTPVAGGQGGGALPITGARAGLVATAGGGLLAAGAAVLMVVRRRRILLRAD